MASWIDLGIVQSEAFELLVLLRVRDSQALLALCLIYRVIPLGFFGPWPCFVSSMGVSSVLAIFVPFLRVFFFSGSPVWPGL